MLRASRAWHGTWSKHYEIGTRRKEGCDERPSTLAQDCQNRHDIGRASGHRCRAGSQYSLQLPHLCPARQSRQRTATDERQLHIERPVAGTGGIALHNHPHREFLSAETAAAQPRRNNISANPWIFGEIIVTLQAKGIKRYDYGSNNKDFYR